MHFLCLEPRETDKIVLKFTKNLVLKFHFLLLGALTLSLVSHSFGQCTVFAGHVECVLPLCRFLASLEFLSSHP